MALEGSALGLFLAAPILLSILLPPLIATRSTIRQQLLTLSATLLPWYIFWFVIKWLTFPFQQRPVSLPLSGYWGEWMGSVIVLSAFAATLSAFTSLLSAIRLPRWLIPALITPLALAWLTWPIWTSPFWTGAENQPSLEPLLFVNPAINLNGMVYKQYGGWMEQSVAYHLTNLNQDVPFSFPRTLWPMVLWHLGFAALLFFLSALITARSPSPELKIARPGS